MESDASCDQDEKHPGVEREPNHEKIRVIMRLKNVGEEIKMQKQMLTELKA